MGTAPAKAILLGEHAVVYGRPAIAVPVRALQARATLEPADRGEPGELWIEAPGIGFSGRMELFAAEKPSAGSSNEQVEGLVRAVRATLDHFGVSPGAALRLQLISGIPVASGLGSSAAVTVAVMRAVAEYLNERLPAEVASGLAFEIEKHYHGTPSGIDNSVVAYGAPIYFVKGRSAEPIGIQFPFHLVLADCGIRSATGEMVAAVRRRWRTDRNRHERLFDEIGELVERARQTIEDESLRLPSRAENGNKGEDSLREQAIGAEGTRRLGELMDRNHELLRELGVSTPELEALVQVAHEAGALGAKLSGAGGGGLVLAVALSQQAEAVKTAMHQAGAAIAITTGIGI